MTRLLLVVCSMTLAHQLQTHDHQRWSSNVEPGVKPSGVENEQCLQRLIGRAH